MFWYNDKYPYIKGVNILLFSAKSKEKAEETVEPAKKSEDEVIVVENPAGTPSKLETKKANNKESPVPEASKEKR